MASTNLKPYLKGLRKVIGKKLGMPAYQEINAQDYEAQIDRIPTIADDSIPKYKGPFMITPTDHPQTIQLEKKYVEANVTVGGVPQYTGPTNVTPSQAVQTLETAGKQVPRNITIQAAPPSGVEIKKWNPKNNYEILKSNKYIVPLYIKCNKESGSYTSQEVTSVIGLSIITVNSRTELLSTYFRFTTDSNVYGSASIRTNTLINRKIHTFYYSLYVPYNSQTCNIQFNHTIVEPEKSIKINIDFIGFENNLTIKDFTIYYYEVN